MTSLERSELISRLKNLPLEDRVSVCMEVFDSDTDNDGQIVLYTSAKINPDTNDIVPFEQG